ncbi:DNA-binding transcriptional regulator, MarR family [Clostridium frigidicarnis]|uniref:DNA-binding transcriptional regulator, MarR family n=1 Tax=Clostridium frigidicarnis TaxID=84698 RepID=A0A1I0YHV7_9CLOT|nr:DNA-binding transcriptional regulator, MarR family [Clostridium frigidicarnis]
MKKLILSINNLKSECMDNLNLNGLSNNLYDLMMILHKKVFNMGEIMKTFPVPPSHVKVIFFLSHNGPCPVSMIAKDLEISKPNMTPIIDKLLSEGLVNRCYDENDRRIIIIELTDEARKLFKRQQQKIKDMLCDKISHLDADDLDSLNLIVPKMLKITSKLD